MHICSLRYRVAALQLSSYINLCKHTSTIHLFILQKNIFFAIHQLFFIHFLFQTFFYYHLLSFHLGRSLVLSVYSTSICLVYFYLSLLPLSSQFCHFYSIFIPLLPSTSPQTALTIFTFRYSSPLISSSLLFSSLFFALLLSYLSSSPLHLFPPFSASQPFSAISASLCLSSPLFASLRFSLNLFLSTCKNLAQGSITTTYQLDQLIIK